MSTPPQKVETFLDFFQKIILIIVYEAIFSFVGLFVLSIIGSILAKIIGFNNHNLDAFLTILILVIDVIILIGFTVNYIQNSKKFAAELSYFNSKGFRTRLENDIKAFQIKLEEEQCNHKVYFSDLENECNKYGFPINYIDYINQINFYVQNRRTDTFKEAVDLLEEDFIV